MKLWLHRLYLPRATPGSLVADALVLATLEEVWRGNGPDSCVPEGTYKLVKHSGKKYRDTWALVGGTVSHQPEAGKQRSAILFHAGNTVEDTLGCILPGRRIEFSMNGDARIYESTLAMQALRAHLANESEHELIVQRG